MKVLADFAQSFDIPPNRLYTLRDKRLKEKKPVFDLISGNVNTQGILFPALLLKSALAEGLKKAKVYHPNPLGQPAAREAIQRYYASEGIVIPPEQIVLTPGTSISYWYVFKLLANVGDEILCPKPSYPLFDTIAQLSGVRLTYYPLRPTPHPPLSPGRGRAELGVRGRWAIDFDAFAQAITPRTRAIVLISPHNPTGAVATQEEVQQLADIARRHHLAIISDEVFSPFVYSGALARPLQTNSPLVITMNGFSKMLALPGAKIGWILVSGERELVQRSIRTLEMVSDTFLPVNEATQFAVPSLLQKSSAFRKSYAREIKKRLDLTLSLLKGAKNLSFVEPEGGFFLALMLAPGTDEEELALRLLDRHGLLVHPGYFYDMEGEHLVMSFVSQPKVLKKALVFLLKEIAGDRAV